MFKKPTLSGLSLALLLVSGGHAFAHAHLRTQMPAADAVVTTSPTALTLGFSEALEVGLSGVTLKGAENQTIPTGAAALVPNDDKQLSVPLTGQLAAGKYTVDWHALSKDGHTTHGSYQFTVGQ